MNVRTWITVFALGCLSTAAGRYAPAQEAPTSLTELLHRGDVFYAAFNNAEAHHTFLDAFAVAPNAFDVLVRLAKTTVELGMDVEAAEQMEEAEALYSEAVGYAEELLRLFPDSAKTYFHLIRTQGKLALFRGGREKVETGRNVEQYGRRGLELDANDPDLHAGFGIFKREVAHLSWVERTFAKALFGHIPEGTRAEAIQFLERAIALRPDFTFAHFELAVTYVGMGEREAAAEEFQKALDLPAATTQDVRNRDIARRMLERLR
jgi:tetratricopeptide (TPR) repeat protein